MQNEKQNKQPKPWNIGRQYFQFKNEVWDTSMWKSANIRGGYNPRLHG